MSLRTHEEDLCIGDVGPSWRNDGEEGLSPSDNELLPGWLSSDNREDEGPDNDARDKLHKLELYRAHTPRAHCAIYRFTNFVNLREIMEMLLSCSNET